MKRKPFKKVSIPIYDCELNLYIDEKKYLETMNEVEGYETEYEEDELWGQCAQIVKDGKHVYYIAWFDNKLSTLSHEVCHACVMILTAHKINIPDSNGEVMAMLLDYIMEQLELD